METATKNQRVKKPFKESAGFHDKHAPAVLKIKWGYPVGFKTVLDSRNIIE
jgi:hypothetical protein